MDKKKLWQRYENGVYLGLAFLSLFLIVLGHYAISSETGKSVILNLATELLSVALLFFLVKIVLLDKSDTADQNKKIAVVLCHGSKKLELPVELRRAEFTRAEILGRIGMIPMNEKGKRFTIRYFNTTDFLRAINTASESEAEGGGILAIPCDEEEFSQFDLPEN